MRQPTPSRKPCELTHGRREPTGLPGPVGRRVAGDDGGGPEADARPAPDRCGLPVADGPKQRRVPFPTGRGRRPARFGLTGGGTYNWGYLMRRAGFAIGICATLAAVWAAPAVAEES